MQQILEMLAKFQVIQERMEADRKSNREELKRLVNAILERMDANLKDLKGEIKSGQAEMRSTIYAFLSELKETTQHEMKSVIQSVRSELDKTTICPEATKTEPNPEMMQSIEEH
jgi:actin-like ATPase involved in cell morphogenesis